ncbi:hypothetical protein GCM10010124_04940 [Pilimelia terevasa]|uniref:Uncharacterized protein n=1 Tax=Pilimelia terevasa TaxID=53372 RepID=A0A8J3FES8_9ACTN|nr:hypothetical protein GCM10010124_04940 [Pilimelia terevasa]
MSRTMTYRVLNNGIRRAGISIAVSPSGRFVAQAPGVLTHATPYDVAGPVSLIHGFGLRIVATTHVSLDSPSNEG